MPHRLSPHAERDLDDIAWRIADETGSVATAERLIDSIASRLCLLAEHPRIGRPRNDLLPGLRSFPVGNYVIVYDLDGEDVRILRIIHGRRNIRALFGP